MPYGEADAQVLHTQPGGQGMPTGVRGARPRVLVVDDNPTNVEFLVDLLGMTGFDVVGRPGVDEALQTLDAQDVDLVITDLVMPERDGFDLIRSIRAGKRRPDLPIIVASASAFPGDQVRATAIGANEFLSKPVDASQLLQRMDALLKVEFLYGAEASDGVAPQPHQATLASSMSRSWT